MKNVSKLLGFLPFLLAFATSAQAAEPEYTLNPGDVLQITVWKEDGLDREVLVLPDGSISFPLIGSLEARDKTVSQIQDEVKTKLSSAIPDASVIVVVKAALGHAVDVVGQVNKPGEVISGHRITVMQALSMAGGLTPYASHSDIIVLHREAGKETSVSFPYDDVIRGRELDKDVVLKAGDVIVVPTAGVLPSIELPSIGLPW